MSLNLFIDLKSGLILFLKKILLDYLKSFIKESEINFEKSVSTCLVELLLWL